MTQQNLQLIEDYLNCRRKDFIKNLDKPNLIDLKFACKDDNILNIQFVDNTLNKKNISINLKEQDLVIELKKIDFKENIINEIYKLISNFSEKTYYMSNKQSRIAG